MTAMTHHRRFIRAMALIVLLLFALSLIGPMPRVYAATATDTFDSIATGTLPADWSATTAGGTVLVENIPGNGDKSLVLNDTSSSTKVTATRPFTTTSGETIVRYRVRVDQTNATSALSVRGPANQLAVTVAFGNNGQIYGYNGANQVNLQPYSANTDYNIKIVARPYAGTYDVYIENAKLVDNLAFRNPTNSLNNLFLNSSDATTGRDIYDYISITTPELAIAYPQIGSIQPRSASQISGSNWSIGAETLDRDFANYDAYKSYLGPLGAKQIRLQGGWAKTEQTPGVYNWAWLDTIVNDAVAQGLQPWIQTSYGNPIYSGGGGSGLGGGIPTSTTALAAWDAWVGAMVDRYKDRVNTWEVWNEPNINSNVSATAYANFYIRTAEVIRARQPDAQIYALALAGISTGYTNEFLNRLQSQGKLGLVDEITYHGYVLVPESHYNAVQSLRNTIAQYSATITVRQGENGAPSTQGPFGALREHPWTELSQAKWNLRRMLGDLGRDIPSSVFTIIDLQYPTGWNYKGLLRANANQTVAYPKAAYGAVQHVTALFDNSLTRIPNYAFSATPAQSIVLFGYTKAGSGYHAITIWQGGSVPSDNVAPTPVTFTFSQGNFNDPVYVDLRTGAVYDIPDNTWSRSGNSYTFTNVPMYDSPIVITDRSIALP